MDLLSRIDDAAYAQVEGQSFFESAAGPRNVASLYIVHVKTLVTAQHQLRTGGDRDRNATEFYCRG